MSFSHVPLETPLELKSVTTTNGRYYITPDGHKYPSITTVLGAEDKPWLVAWQKSLGKNKADKEKERCAARGEAVHLMAELYLKNILTPTLNHTTENIKLFNQLKFKLNHINTITAQEIAIYSDVLKIAGRVDCIAEYKNVLSIIDFKTSNNIKDEEKIEDYKLQCATYALCFLEMYGVLIEKYTILIAVENSIMPLEFTGSIKDYVIKLKKRIDSYYSQNKHINLLK